MRALGLLGALLFVSAAPVSAATISVSLTGTIESIDSAIASGPFAVGDPVNISFEIDSTKPDAIPGDPNVGEYSGAVSNMSIMFGGYTASQRATGPLTIDDNSPLGTDEFDARSSIIFGDDVAGIPPSYLRLGMSSTTNTVFSSDAIPTSLDLADFDRERVVVLYFYSVNSGLVHATATVDSLSYTVPEPGALVLIAFGGILAVVPRR